MKRITPKRLALALARSLALATAGVTAMFAVVGATFAVGITVGKFLISLGLPPGAASVISIFAFMVTLLAFVSLPTYFL
jgi:hypothetical protein